MTNATAFVLSAIEESFTAVGALSTAFDAGLAAVRDHTLSNRASTHGAYSSSHRTNAARSRRCSRRSFRPRTQNTGYKFYA
jgi:hypothetical protein